MKEILFQLKLFEHSFMILTWEQLLNLSLFFKEKLRNKYHLQLNLLQ